MHLHITKYSMDSNIPYCTVGICPFRCADAPSDDALSFVPDTAARPRRGTSACKPFGRAAWQSAGSWCERWFCTRCTSSGVRVSARFWTVFDYFGLVICAWITKLTSLTISPRVLSTDIIALFCVTWLIPRRALFFNFILGTYHIILFSSFGFWTVRAFAVCSIFIDHNY